LDFGFSSDFFWFFIGTLDLRIAYRSYLTRQTYNEVGMGTREEVLDLIVDEFTAVIVELRRRR
jgi:hypothetical protein